MPDSQDVPTIVPRVAPLFVSTRCARTSLGDASEAVFWGWVKAGHIPLVPCGRKRLVPYAALVEFARRVEAGELATGRKGFSNHEKAIANSIASRRRKPRSPGRLDRSPRPSEERVSDAKK
jgi:hypothetical protein